MKDWYKKAGVLWSIISALFVGLVAMIALNLSYEPEIKRLRLENIVQDSIIVFQRIDIEGLRKKVNSEFNNIYDVFHTHNNKIKSLMEDN